MVQHQIIEQSFSIPSTFAGERLDHALATIVQDYSRARWQTWIKEGAVLVDGKQQAAKYHVKGGEQISLKATLALQQEWQAESLDLNIVYEDDDLLVLNKPADCVVHPAAGNYEGTLANALLHHIPTLATVPRAGLIHRLDKDTTGLLVVAKSLTAHHSLVKQLAERRVKREYVALVNGIVTAGATIDAPIGRHPRLRTKMAVVASGKPAVTHYRVSTRFKHHTLLSVSLETGRTHQIRVHLSHNHYPIVGDPLYSRSPVLPPNSSAILQDTLKHFKRQALHAARLGFMHPLRAEPVEWSCPLPSDMQHLLDVLAAEEKHSLSPPL